MNKILEILSKKSSIILLLIIITGISYWPMYENDFIRGYDDYAYILNNEHVKTGLTFDNIKWAFTEFYASNWHPFTWISHMIDCQISGLNPGWHHLVNLILHISNTLLIFYFLTISTGSIFKSAFVSALFAVHPLHVESVAWVAERKDLLSTFFCLISIVFYVYYSQKKHLKYIIISLLFFIFSLLSKSMYVTLPFLFILLDIWPLKRTTLHYKYTLIFEKIPFLCLSIVSCIITYMAQVDNSSVINLKYLSYTARSINVICSYIFYLWKMLWPTKLCVFYPYNVNISLIIIFILFFILLIITSLTIITVKKHKFLFTGWFWYLGMLVPVIGIVQVGSQSHADRYTYMPLVGIFIMIAWSLGLLYNRIKHGRLLIITTSILAVLSCILVTNIQVQFWKNDVRLFEKTVLDTKDNYIAHNNLGNIYNRRKIFNRAIFHHFQTLRIIPDFTEGFNDLGEVYINIAQQQDSSEYIYTAIHYFKKALFTDSNSCNAYYNMAIAFAQLDSNRKSIENYKKAIECNPKLWNVMNNLSIQYAKTENYDSALILLNKAIEIKPAGVNLYMNRANIYLQKKHPKSAFKDYQHLCSMFPENAFLRFNIGLILESNGYNKKAIYYYKKAAELLPDNEQFIQKMESFKIQKQ